MISKQQFEAQLQQILRLLFENKTQEQIAHELNISTRTVARYCQRIDKRYGEVQRQKNDDTLFLEYHLFKNRMLNLYKALENKVRDDKTSGAEIAKCADIAADIAIEILKMESEGIKAVKELLGAEKETARRLSQSTISSSNNNNDSDMMFYDELEESC
ncbi:MAG TPA: LuxR C-terminal-related transcriptional regulator [Nitrososphaeraceae archaeon]|nr:LuxR C-terminal-related transcriptional regulator [Nitrososphaeraceae archaeon]